MTHQDAYELAWKENRAKLIKMANQNTFLALEAAFELAWKLTTVGSFNDSPTDRTV